MSFKSLWSFFNGKIVKQVFIDPGDAVTECTTEWKTRLETLKDPKTVIDREMKKPDSNLSLSMLDEPVATLLPSLRKKVEKYPHDAALKLFTDLLERCWTRYLNIMYNHTSAASNIFYFKMAFDQSRETDALPRYLATITIKSAFGTKLWNLPANSYARNCASNNRVMCLFYWYNVRAIDYDYPERYVYEMTLEQRSEAKKLNDKINHIHREIDEIRCFLNSCHTKLVHDTRTMIAQENQWFEDMKVNDPRKTLEQITDTKQYLSARQKDIEVVYTSISNNVTFGVDEPANWANGIYDEVAKMKAAILNHITQMERANDLRGNDEDTKRHIGAIILDIRNYIDKEYIESWMHEEKKIVEDERYKNAIQKQLDLDRRVRSYWLSVVAYRTYNFRYEQFQRLVHVVKLVAESLFKFETDKTVNDFIQFMESKHIEPLIEKEEDFNKLVQHLETGYKDAIHIQTMHYQRARYTGLMKWAQHVRSQDNLTDMKNALNTDTAYMDCADLRTKEVRLSTNRGSNSSVGDDIDKMVASSSDEPVESYGIPVFMSKCEKIDKCILEFVNVGFNPLIAKQRDIISHDDIRRDYTTNTLAWLDSITCLPDRWQLTHFDVVGLDYYTQLVEQFIVPVTSSLSSSSSHSNNPSLSYAYNTLQDFQHLENAFQHTNIQRVWKCIVSLWKICVITNPNSIIQ